MGKEKKKINVLTAFFISHKSDVKIFFNWILNQCSKDTRSHYYLNNLPTQFYYFSTIFPYGVQESKTKIPLQMSRNAAINA